MNRKSRCVGTGLVLLSGAAVLAAGIADPAMAVSSRVVLAQKHEHGQQVGGQHVPSTAQQQPPKTEMPPPMTEMPGMEDLAHGAEAAGAGRHDMSPVDSSGAPDAGTGARGGQLLQPTMQDGVKEFALTTGVVRWHILPDVEVGAYAYNGQVPGPLIRVQPKTASGSGSPTTCRTPPRCTGTG